MGKKTMTDWTETKDYITELCADIDKDFKPWMGDAEAAIKEPVAKPNSLDEALALLDSAKNFTGLCGDQKGKLEEAGKARSSMEKASTSENEVEALTERWDAVKKVADDRVARAQALVTTWEDLDKCTNDLAGKMGEVPKQEERQSRGDRQGLRPNEGPLRQEEGTF